MRKWGKKYCQTRWWGIKILSNKMVGHENIFKWDGGTSKYCPMRWWSMKILSNEMVGQEKYCQMRWCGIKIFSNEARYCFVWPCLMHPKLYRLTCVLVCLDPVDDRLHLPVEGAVWFSASVAEGRRSLGDPGMQESSLNVWLPPPSQAASCSNKHYVPSIFSKEFTWQHPMLFKPQFNTS